MHQKTVAVVETFHNGQWMTLNRAELKPGMGDEEVANIIEQLAGYKFGWEGTPVVGADPIRLNTYTGKDALGK